MQGERDRLVAVTYEVNEEFAEIHREVLAGEAGVEVEFLFPLPPQERAPILERAEVVMAWNLPRELDEGVLRSARRLRFLQTISAGLDHVDFAGIPEAVMVAGNSGAYAEPMAEHAMAMALALAKRLPQRHAELARGEFRQWPATITLRDAVCGILGFGGIGRATARLLRAFGARIHAINTSGRTDEPVEFVGTLADLDRVLGAADVLVVALPLTVATRGLVGRRELELMKPTAILVNVARGAIVGEGALFEHLRTHPEFCAGIDAWWREPFRDEAFGVDHPFFELPNVIGSPHDSALVPGIMHHAVRAAALNVRRYLRGEPPVGVARREDYSSITS